MSKLNSPSKTLPQPPIKDFIHNYLTSIFYKIFVSDASPDEQIFEVLHESYVRIAKFVKSTILYFEEGYKGPIMKLIENLKENVFLKAVLVFSAWMASLYDHDLNMQLHKLCQLLIRVWKIFSKFSNKQDGDVRLKSWIYDTFTVKLERTLAKISHCFIKIDPLKDKDITQTAINNLFVSNVMSGGLKNKLLTTYFNQQKHIIDI